MKLQEFYNLELYEQEAVYNAAVNYIDEQNKKQEKTLNSISENLQQIQTPSSKSYSAPKFQFE